jgi:ankyrin repeat protein
MLSDIFYRLCNAARDGNYKECESLLKQKADPDQYVNRLYSPTPPLLLAAQNGHFGIVDLLRKNGATAGDYEVRQIEKGYIAISEGEYLAQDEEEAPPQQLVWNVDLSLPTHVGAKGA